MKQIELLKGTPLGDYKTQLVSIIDGAGTPENIGALRATQKLADVIEASNGVLTLDVSEYQQLLARIAAHEWGMVNVQTGQRVAMDSQSRKHIFAFEDHFKDAKDVEPEDGDPED